MRCIRMHIMVLSQAQKATDWQIWETFIRNQGSATSRLGVVFTRAAGPPSFPQCQTAAYTAYNADDDGFYNSLNA